MAASFYSYCLCFPYCTDPPPLLQMLFSRISSFFGIYIPMLSLFPQAFCFAVSAGKYQPAPVTLLSSSQSPPPTAVENFGSSGVPKVSSLSYVGSTYPCVREAICTGLLTIWRLSSADKGSRQCWQSCCLVSHYCSQWQIKGGERPC